MDRIIQKLIADQFQEYRHLQITKVAQPGHDNHTYRLGEQMLVRLPSNENYVQAIYKEQLLLPEFEKYLNSSVSISVSIPKPIKCGKPSADYPYPFSIYQWLPGESINSLKLRTQELAELAIDLAKFLKALWQIPIAGYQQFKPGAHNYFRGAHISVYAEDFVRQIAKLLDAQMIDQIQADAAKRLWDLANSRKWTVSDVWVHGDFAAGNLLWHNGRLSSVIDFGSCAIGDPSCDLVIAWTLLTGESRKIFINELSSDLDVTVWLRAKAWALWKSTFLMQQPLDEKLKGDLGQNFLAQKSLFIDLISEC